MAEKTPQTKSNHTRFDPMYHFVALPVLLLLLIWTIIHVIRHPFTETAALVVIALLMILMTLKLRNYPLKVQDRVIRLEERLRLARLLPEPLRSRSEALSESQLIALRFASDAELPALVERTLQENLTRKQIKKAIRDWRPDYWRV